MNITHGGLRRIFLNFPLLTHLTLDFVRVDTSLIEKDIIPRAIFPPRLKALEWYHVLTETRYDHVSKHLMAHGPYLKKFTMQLQSEALVPDQNNEIIFMKGAGLEVNVWAGW